MARENYTFSAVPTASIPRSTFNRSHGHKTAFNSGYLIPVYVDEVLPGDTFKLNASFFTRLATPLTPFMDNLHLDAFFFFVPNRLLWDNWQRFCGEQTAPNDSTDYEIPVINGGETGFDRDSIYDYMGVPCGIPNLEISALWLRAYNLIWNEWFRDQNLMEPVTVNTGDGPDGPGAYELKRRAKRHDYFTSCLPWPQKGPGVMVSIGQEAPVLAPPGISPTLVFDNGTNPVTTTLNVDPSINPPITPNFNVSVAPGSGGNLGAGSAPLTWQNGDTGLIADLSQAEAITINSLRQSFQIQKLLERDARGGTRYTEILRSHFGVVSPDARLQRPEYLGGGSMPITINPVTQTSNTANQPKPQGNLAAYGVGATKGMGFSKSFVEHGVLIGLVMVRADLSYQQGLHRMWSRRTRYDFYWPAFAHLGEQAVLNKELYATGSTDPVTGDDAVFGYQERYAEYRYFPSKITGVLNSTHPTPLDMWHLAQEFTALPTLNETFISENPPVERVVAVTSEPQFLFDSHFSIACTRPMPTYSVPGLIDHF